MNNAGKVTAVANREAAMNLAIEESDRLQTVGLWVVAWLAVILPFELKDPLFTVGPLDITTVEIGVYCTAGAWAAGCFPPRRRHWTFAHTAVAIFAIVGILSALLAPAHKGESLKFAFRVLGGCILCFAAARFVRTPRDVALVCSGLLAGSLVSAAAAQAELWLPGAAEFLARFKTGSSMTGSYPRASGVFQYANIASMYWEATLPLAPAVFLWWGRRRFPRQCRPAAFLGVLLLSEAILIAASRAGVLIAILILAALLCIPRGSITSFRRLTGLSLICLFALIGGHLAWNPLLFLRLTTPDLSDWYHAEFSDYPRELTIEAGEIIRVPLTVRNRGRLSWHAQGNQSQHHSGQTEKRNSKVLTGASEPLANSWTLST